MLRTRVAQVHALLLSFLLLTLTLLLNTPATAQQQIADQPSRRYFFLPAQQDANAPKHVPVTRLQKDLAVPAATPLAPSFSTGIYSSGGEYAVTVAAGDLNGDGWPDLVVSNECYRFFMTCNQDGGSVSVLMGTGGGGFSSPTEYYSGGTYTYGAAIADANGDGKLDVLVASTCYAGGYGCIPVGELLGNGDGTLQPVQPYSFAWVWSLPGSSVTVDVNGDGIPDLITLGDSTVNVQLGNGDGTFQPAISFDSGGIGAATIAVADVNRDGKPDLLVANMCANDDACRHSWSGTVGVLINGTPYTATTTKLVSSSNPSSTGQSVTFTATVTPNSGTLPDGELVTFKNGDTVLGTASLSGGIASLTTSTLPVGTFPITATYAFDGIYGASSAQLQQQVNAAVRYASSVSLTVSPNEAYFDQTVGFTARVKSFHGPIPDGEFVTFYSGNTALGVAPTAGGVATFVTSQLPANNYTAKAVYSGDSTFTPSAGTAPLTVEGVPTAVYLLGSSPNPSIYGQKVSITSAVFSPYATPTGKVKFTWNTYTLGTAALVASDQFSSTATLTVSALNADTYPVTATYLGDSINAASTSSLLTQVVLQATTAATITSSANPATQGQPVTFTAHITSPTVIAKGLVTFTAGTTVLGTVQLSAGKATLTTSALQAGTTAVTVTYEGDSNIAKTSASVTQVVQ